MYSKFYFSLIFISLFVFEVNAQTIICGKIIDSETNQPISAVNIWIKNTVIGTTSDENGKFCISSTAAIQDEMVLVFSQLTYQNKKVTINNSENLIISLNPTTVQLTEIVVSSSKTANSTKGQTTLPVILSKNAILENVTQNIPELLLKQPGVSLAGTGYHTAPSIRGLARKRVVVMVDGEKVSSERNVGAPGTFVNPFEIEKIEILKGPYSTLYGSDAVGGVVNIITKSYETPYYNDKIGGRLDLSYKSVNNGKNANLALNGKLNKLQYHINTGYRDSDEYKQADGEKAFNSFFKEQHVGGKLKYFLNDKHQFSFKTSYSKGGPIGFPAHSTLTNAIHDYDNHFIIGLNHKMNTNRKYLKKTELNFTRHAHDLGADIIVHKVESNPNADKRISMRIDLDGIDYIAQYDMFFTLNDKFKILTGFDGYFRENIDVKAKKIVTNYNSGLFIMEVEDVSLSNASQRSYGVFSQVDYTASDKIHFNAGIRYNYITTQQPDQPTEDQNNKALSGNFGISYSPINQLTIKANVGSAFRVPDIKELFVTTQTPGGMNISNKDLVPEQSLNLDLALVYHGKSNLIQLSTFRNQINDMIILDWDYSTNPRTGTYENIGEGLLYGVEFSYNQKITDDFSGYLNATKIYGFDVNADDELMDVPPLQFNAGLKYKLNNKLWFNLSGRYSAEQTDVATGDYTTDAFTTFDFSAKWKIATNINAYFSVTNLLNEAYREHYHFEWIQAAGRSFNIGMNFNF